MTLTDLMSTILDDACPATSVDDGFNLYRISSHCAEIEVTARKVNGMWEVRGFQYID